MLLPPSIFHNQSRSIFYWSLQCIVSMCSLVDLRVLLCTKDSEFASRVHNYFFAIEWNNYRTLFAKGKYLTCHNFHRQLLLEMPQLFLFLTPRLYRICYRFCGLSVLSCFWWLLTTVLFLRPSFELNFSVTTNDGILTGQGAVEKRRKR